LINKLQSGNDVLDLGRDRGHAINLMAKAFPNTKFVAIIYISNEGIHAAIEEAKLMGLRNVLFEIRYVVSITESEKY
jgi:tRNA G46 methylase TrmB